MDSRGQRSSALIHLSLRKAELEDMERDFSEKEK